MKYLLIILTLCTYQVVSGQDLTHPTSKGSLILTSNSSNIISQKTGLSLKLVDKTEYEDIYLGRYDVQNTIYYAFGVDFSYFVMDNFALNFGTGIANTPQDKQTVNHKFGIGYYIKNKVPLQINYHFKYYASNRFEIDKYHFLSFESGYLIELSPSVLISPTFQYFVNAEGDDEIDFLQIRLDFKYKLNNISKRIKSERHHTDKGKWLIENNFGNSSYSNTALNVFNNDGDGAWNLGLDLGYFLIKNLAVKAGFSAEVSNDDIYSIHLGSKYFLNGNIPIAVEYKRLFYDKRNLEQESSLKTSLGYALFLGKNISLQPNIEVNVPLTEGESLFMDFSFGIGLHL